jgi:hypothetical protein
MIISERIGTDLAGVNQAIRNGDRASSVIATTEASLTEVTDLLNNIKALMVEAANTGGNSKEEREANQLQIDSAIQSITRISNTASFGGLRLLDGGLDYVTSGVAQSDDHQGADLRRQLHRHAAAAGRGRRARLGPDGQPLPQRRGRRDHHGRGARELDDDPGDGQPGRAGADVHVGRHVRIDRASGEQPDRADRCDRGHHQRTTSGSTLVFRSEGYGTSNFVSVERVSVDNGTRRPTA